jgi:hypothetical protein
VKFTDAKDQRVPPRLPKLRQATGRRCCLKSPGEIQTSFASARRHRCERPLRMDAPPTGWVTALAGFLARGSLLAPGLPGCPVAMMGARSPRTVAGAATAWPIGRSVFPLAFPASAEKPTRRKFPMRPGRRQARAARHSTPRRSGPMQMLAQCARSRAHDRRHGGRHNAGIATRRRRLHVGGFCVSAIIQSK